MFYCSLGGDPCMHNFCNLSQNIYINRNINEKYFWHKETRRIPMSGNYYLFFDK